MTIPSIPKSSPIIDGKIARVRRQKKVSYRLVGIASKRFVSSLIVGGVIFLVGLLGKMHSVIDGALLLTGSVISGCVCFGRFWLASNLRQHEFRIVLEVNEKFMRMFNLIGEGILTKEEFRKKATDLVGEEQVDRFFERRELENEHRVGNLTNDQFSERMSLIGYGPEQALEEWQFALWESEAALRNVE